jgi:hypothetical protein
MDESSGQPLSDTGFEFTIGVRGSVPGDTSLSKAEDKVYGAVSKTVEAILSGQIQ